MRVSHVTDPAPSGDRAPGPVRNGYRAAIIGAGFMGRVHAQAVRTAGGRVVGVASSTPERAAESAAALGAERAYADAAELIGSDEVDVVHVCTPNHLHAPLSLAAFDAGRHVVCEKPLATDPGTALRMADAADSSGRVGAVPFVYRFHPMAREARALVRSGAIGRVHLAHGGYLQDWLLRPADDNWRMDPELGGPSRAFGDIGSHWCDMLEFVLGDRISAVSAQTSTPIPRDSSGGAPVPTEDLVVLQFRTHGGVIGSAVISQVSAGRKNRLVLEVSGAEQSLMFDQEQPELLWEGDRGSSRLRMRDADTLSPDAARLSLLPAGHPQGYQDCFNAFVADTAAAIATGTAPDGLPVFADGLRSARVAAAVLESAREERWVPVAD